MLKERKYNVHKCVVDGTKIIERSYRKQFSQIALKRTFEWRESNTKSPQIYWVFFNKWAHKSQLLFF